MADHRSELRRELLAAAHRSSSNAEERSRHAPRRAKLFIATGVVGVIAALSLVVVRESDPAAANVFSFTVQDDDLVIEIVGSVDDADAAVEELGAEGIHADLVPVPAAPSLVGQIVSAFSDFDEVEATSSGGRTTEMRIPADSPGTLTIRYGRDAEANEEYEATESVPDCGSAYAGRPVTDSLRRQLADTYGPTLRWQEIDAGTPSNITGDEIRPSALIVDVLPVNPRTVLVLVTDGTSSPPSGMSCRNS